MFQENFAQSPARGDAEPLDQRAHQEASRLLERYPNLSEVELARLINLYRELSALDVALMLSDERLGPKLGQFFDDNRSKVRTPFRQYAVLVGIALAGFAIMFWSVAFRG